MTDQARPPRGTGGRPGDAGSASVWVLAFAVLSLSVAAVAVLRAAAVLARHRAESAADLAVLAAAQRIGLATDPCAAAGPSAVANGARLVSCAVEVDASGRVGSVTVTVERSITLPVVGGRTVRATARAGRLPADSPGR